MKKTLTKYILAALTTAVMLAGLAVLLPGRAAAGTTKIFTPDGLVYELRDSSNPDAIHGEGAYVRGYIGSDTNVVVPKSIFGHDVIWVELIFDYPQFEMSVQLTSIDVSACTELLFLDCSNNKLTEIDVANSSKLEELVCDSNLITSLDISKNTALWYLRCSNNKLTEIDVSKNLNLEWLLCDNNPLKTIDVSKNAALKDLWCYGTNLNELDLSRNTSLRELWCYGINLNVLDVSKNTELEALNCSENNLTTIDLSQNTALVLLYCSSNMLTTLDVTLNQALRDLRCDDNDLSILDISKNPDLETLFCNENNLTTLDVSNHIWLRHLYCQLNYFASEANIIGLNPPQLSEYSFGLQKNGSPPKFTDISSRSWYAPYVTWASDNSVVTGYPDNTFRPNNTMPRAEFVQVLYSLAGKPAVAATTAFTDVKSDDWYVKAVSWAVDSGITSGVGGGEFDPGGSVTREQAVAFLYKYAKLKGDNKDYSGVVLTFGDKSDISDWAIPAVQWSAANKIVGGYPDGTFGPQNTATRAEVVTILYGYEN
ncbi:MAG: S-layer homology domain-containing protein [Oscillospiraceae bacterium]|jgi:hypothetical protein|nr:S-layer homology domain-containing protein [Oscillospiraceae bacterium]